jgi:hypothetical protein
MGEAKRKEEEAVVAKLKLLEKMMKLHEWSAFEEKEAVELEEAEAEIDSEDSSPTSG